MKLKQSAALLLIAVSGIQAATNGFVVPHFRGMPGSVAGGWEVFTVGTDNGIGNAPDLAGNLTGARLRQLDPGAFVTGSGNIYNLGGVSSFVLTHASDTPLGWVTFQARTLGAELDYGSMRISYELGGETFQIAPLGRMELDRGTQLGVNVSSRWDWDVNAIGLTDYRIEFVAAGSSLSFDSATLDGAAVGVVPEPSTWAMLVVGVAGLLWIGGRNRG